MKSLGILVCDPNTTTTPHLFSTAVMELSEKALSDISQKIETARKYKEEGNVYFREEKYSKAKSKYGIALAYITGFPGSKRNQTGYESLASQTMKTTLATDEEEALATELELILQQNIATCYIKMSNSQKAIYHCNKALALDANAWKAKLRKGEALIMKESYDEAKTILEEAMRSTADPVNLRAIRSALRKREIEMKKSELEAQERLRVMFFGKRSSNDSTSMEESKRDDHNMDIKPCGADAESN